jgi:NAD(P)H-dependent FMN reductase
MVMTLMSMDARRNASPPPAVMASFEWISPKAPLTTKPVMTATTPTMMPV